MLFSCENEIEKIEKTDIVPKPDFIEIKKGSFLLDKNVFIEISNNYNELESVKEYFTSYMKDYFQLNFAFYGSSSIKLSIDEGLKGTDAYNLAVTKNGIQITGSNAAGVFYGIQSLIQILPSKNSKTEAFELPFFNIKDSANFKWRGVHLDVCRHFFPVDFVKKTIDMAARLKLNTFHWHLTEDQGWRIEIKKYPKLTEIGAWRNKTLIGHGLETPEKYDSAKHGGFYTQEQIKEVVEYAKKRFVTIVPEIEMPGHAVAALASYPEYSCTGKKLEVESKWGVFDDVYCAGKETTFFFLEDILSEVIDLFPGEYIHIGGDECPKTRWKECEECQNRIENENLKNEHELQSYFIKRIEKFLNSKGKKLIGWDEILEGGLSKTAAVMSWRGEVGGIEAAMQGNFVVMSPNATNYFDHYQGTMNEPLAIGGLTTLKDVYTYQPIPESLKEEYKKYILGAQANLWTEYIPSEEHAEYMLYPRLCALAENLWTDKSSQNWDDFILRMGTFYEHLDNWGVNYRLNAPEGIQQLTRTLNDTIIIELDNNLPDVPVFYTLDGSEPTMISSKYEKPIKLKLDSFITIKAVSIKRNRKKSPTIEGTYEKMTYFEPVNTQNYSYGITYNYYEGKFSSAKKIDALEIYNGVVSTLKLPEDRSENFFAVKYQGYLKIPADGIYTFYLTSSDGSVLYIYDKLVVDNDGFHWATTKSGKIALKAGLQPFRINYFKAKRGSYFDIKVEGPNINKQKIPDNWLWN